MTSESWRINISPFGDAFGIYIDSADGLKTVTALHWREIGLYESCPPPMHLTKETIQHLIDQLYALGFRPSTAAEKTFEMIKEAEKQDTQGECDATKS